MPACLTTDLTAEKIRFHHLLHDLQILLERAQAEHESNFYYLLATLAQHYGIAAEVLLAQGIRRAYRQLVEGV